MQTTVAQSIARASTRAAARVRASTNAPKAEADAAVQRDYDKALADGVCGPKRARFHNWTQ
jgi:hypothetical protein